MSERNPYESPEARVDTPDPARSMRQRWMLTILLAVCCALRALFIIGEMSRTLRVTAGNEVALVLSLLAMAAGTVALALRPRLARFAFLLAVLVDASIWWQWQPSPSIVLSLPSFLISAFVLAADGSTAARHA